MTLPVKCPKCHHEFIAPTERRSSTLRSAVLDIPIRTDAPMCVCEHVRVLHEDDGAGPCTLCGMASCGQFIEKP
jgi:hypothetical protein